VIIREVSPDVSSDAEKPHSATVVHVLLVDRDPLSRHFLTNALSGMGGIEVSLAPLDTSDYRPPANVHVVLVASTPIDATELSQLRALTATRVRVLMLGVDWTPERLQDALKAGVAGCVTKNANVAGLVAAVHAVASGHVVISPELVGYLEPPPEPQTVVPADILAKLTAREVEVLDLLAEGMSTSEIAAQLCVSNATVKSHVSHLLTKLGVRNRTQAALIAKELKAQAR